MKALLSVPAEHELDGGTVARSLSSAGVEVRLAGPGEDADLLLVRGDRVDTRADEPRLAVIARPEPRDVVMSLDPGNGTLSRLPRGASVGVVGALRRELLAVHRPDLAPLELEDEADLVGLLENGRVRGIIMDALAARRLGLGSYVGEVLEPTAWSTEGGRGAWVLCARAQVSDPLRARVEAVDDELARQALTAELAVLERLGVGTGAPVGVLARTHGNLLRIRAMVPQGVGRRLVRAEHSGPRTDARAAGLRLGARLLDRGARELLSMDTAP